MSKPENPFRYFNSSPEVIRLVVMLYVRFPLSLRNLEDLLIKRGIDLCHETVRLWCHRLVGCSLRTLDASWRLIDLVQWLHDEMPRAWAERGRMMVIRLGSCLASSTVAWPERAYS